MTQAAGEPDWSLPHGVRKGTATETAGSLVQAIGAGLAVVAYLPVGSTGQVNKTKAPPLLLLLDTRTGKDTSLKNTSLVLGARRRSFHCRPLPSLGLLLPCTPCQAVFH